MYDEIEELLVLLLKKKINKDTLKKLLQIRNIPFSTFNESIYKLISEEKRQTDKTNQPCIVKKILDDSFMKDLLMRKTGGSNKSEIGVNKEPIIGSSRFLLEKKLNFESLYRSNSYLTYKLSGRLLNIDELKHKFQEYNKILGMNTEVKDEVVEFLNRGLELFIKNLLENCKNDFSKEKIKLMLGKNKNLFNIYDNIT